MPNEIYKTASVRAKNLEGFAEILSKHNIKPVGEGVSSAKEVAEHLTYGKGGTGSILMDGAGFLIKKTPFVGKKLHSATFGKYKKVQKHLTDFDIETGNKVYNALDKSKTGKKIKNAFIYEHNVPLNNSESGVVDKSIKVKVPMLSAPIENAKRKALPFAGTIYVGDKIMEHEKQNNKGGDTVSREASNREVLIEKIASALSKEKNTPDTANTEVNKTASELFSKASTMLKVAAERERELLMHNEKLACENKQLNNEVNELKKKDKAVKLANLMNEKGMIKKADVDEKISEIMSLSNDAYNMLKQAAENVQVKDDKNGVDNLTFLAGDYNIKSSNMKKTLADVLGDNANQY